MEHEALRPNLGADVWRKVVRVRSSVRQDVVAVTERTTEPLTPGQMFGQRVKDIRKARGLTQRDAAKLLDVHVTNLNKIERGTRSDVTISRLYAFAAALGTSPTYLLTGHRPPFEEWRAERKLLRECRRALSLLVAAAETPAVHEGDELHTLVLAEAKAALEAYEAAVKP